jgi:Protein of unknown function (DUF962)
MSAATSKIRVFLRNYGQRHRNPWNRACHVVGGPLAPVLFLYLLVRGKFVAAALAFVAGYGLQWLGHHIEGSEVGEWIMLKALTRRVGRMAGATSASRASSDGKRGR